jgi:ribonuclease R
MTAEMLFDKQGKMLESAFYPSIIKSCARLTYTLVKKIIVDHDAAICAQNSAGADVMEMKELSMMLMSMRKLRGSMISTCRNGDHYRLTGQTEGNPSRAQPGHH